MKKLQLDSIKEMLTKERMKKIVGGYGGNPNCNGVGECIDWYCRSGNTCTHIRVMSVTLPPAAVLVEP